MDTNSILVELRAERARIDQAISALEALGSDRGGSHLSISRDSNSRPAAQQQHVGRHMSAAARRRISQMMKKRWAERKRKAARAV